DEDPRWLERHLRVLVGLEGEGGSEDRRTEAFTAWRRFFEALAEERPLVLVFEDLHWADDALLDFVDHLVDWARGVPVLVVATARPELLERRPGWAGGKPNAVTLSLSRLSDDETAELVHALLDTPVLDAEAQRELLARAGGNPLYAEEFARLVEGGRTPDVLPESVQGLIAARLDALTEDEKTLLQAAAVVGKVFWLGAAAAVSASPRWTVEELLHALERKQFVRRERRSSVAGEMEYGFWHVLVRDVAYAQIPRGERAERHSLTAEWIESLGRPEDHAEMLAHHYVAALELARAAGTDDAALTAKVRAATAAAGARALALNAFAAAVRFYSHALELSSDDDPERPELLLNLGRGLHQSMGDQAAHVLDEAASALVAAGRPERAAEAHLLLSELWWDRGKRHDSDEHLECALALLGAETSETRARVLARLARSKQIAGEHDEAIRVGADALSLAEELRLAGVRAHALSSLGGARFYLGDPEGIADLERSIEIALAAGSPVAANAYNNHGFMHFLAGDVERDREGREEAIRLATRFGQERMIRFARGAIPALDFYRGDWEEAERQADVFVAECEASPHYAESNVRWPRALMRLARDDQHGAASDALRAEALSRDAKDLQVLLPALAVRLRVELESGQVDFAADLVREILAAPPSHASRPAAIDLAFSANQLATVAATREWIAAIRYRSGWSEAALAVLDDELERAAELFAAAGSRPDEAYVRLRAAERLVAEGRRAEADEQLQLALTFWREVRATRYIRQAEALLAAAS
ncbi:MAG: hypothetical protein R6W48_09955, partial [Gaiellaceae bacterium]